MLVFILPGLNPHLCENTAASVQSVFSDARHVIIPSEEVTAAILNETLAREFGPWFMTLYAGDSVQPHAKVEIEQWLRTCSDHSAGYIINPVSITDQLAPSKNRHVPYLRIPRGPLLWRTKTVMSGRTPGFRTREQLPFQKYVLNDKQFELSTRYEWMEVDSAGILYHQRAAPAWMKETEEWQAVLPLLQAGSQEQSQPPVVSCPPLVTIALCTYNDGSYLPWAVRSVLAQTFGGWELVILDDGSTDAETAHYLLRVPQDNRIKLIRQEDNTGKSRALNRILNLAKAPWLLELDADDWLAPDALEILIREAGGQQNTAVVYANHMEWLERANKQLVYQGVKVAPSSLSPYVLLQNAPAVAPRMFNVSILKQVDGWDHHILFEGRLYEDIGQLMKLSNTHKLYHIPEALYHRRLRTSSLTHRHPHQYLEWKNSIIGESETWKHDHHSERQNAYE
ncbi:glycosyltransferase family 2 protein [Paenibacillus sp. 2KB_20]|uniref:glycosyltransferase family 2 protein n=1 Tax=Paenibacillus sp. 2KB_20 TaxID=3232977 RepID=UPI003F99D31F